MPLYFPKYSNDWDKLSEACKRRDGYRCRRCGALGYKAGGKTILHAAHIVSKSKGGKEQNDVCPPLQKTYRKTHNYNLPECNLHNNSNNIANLGKVIL